MFSGESWPLFTNTSSSIAGRNPFRINTYEKWRGAGYGPHTYSPPFQGSAELSGWSGYFLTAWSEAILPSRMKMMRCACCAMSFSCVTKMIVFPCR
jgi:hypothetical protein